MNNKLISVLTGTSIATLGMLSVSTSVNAAILTVTDSYTITNQSVPFSEDFTLDSFQTSLGDLIGITITNVVDTTASVRVFNDTGVAQDFVNAFAQVPIAITAPSGTFTTTAEASVPSGTVQPSPPSTSFAGLTDTVTDTFIVDDEDFDLYKDSLVGLSVAFMADANDGTYGGQSVPDVFFSGDAEVGALVSITYTYDVPDPQVTPEPTSLLGLGLIGGLGLLVKRKK